MMDVLDGIVAVIALIGGRPSVKRSACGSNDVLMNIVSRIAVIVNGGMVVEVVVAAEIGSAAGLFDARPKPVAIGWVIVETIFMKVGLKSGFVAEDKDMGFGIGRQLLVQPRLIYTAAFNVLIDTDDKGVIVCERIGEVFFTLRAIVGQIVEELVPCGDILGFALVVVASDGINADTGIVNWLHDLVPCFELDLHCFGVFIAVDQIAGEEDKIDITGGNLGGKFA